jgi:hypothetical protein
VIIERTEPNRDIAERVWDTTSLTPFGIGAAAITRILASPDSGEPYPRGPTRDDPVWCAVQYWSGLLYMLMYSFGWALPGQGLWWWTHNGKPTDEYRLQVLAEIFDANGSA